MSCIAWSQQWQMLEVQCACPTSSDSMAESWPWLQAAYEEHLEASGGSCFVKEVQLCCMQGRQNGSYYQVAGTMQL